MVAPSSSASSSKRPLEASETDLASEQVAARPRTASPNRGENAAEAQASSSTAHEVLSAECLDAIDMPCETLVAEYLRKKIKNCHIAQTT